VPPTPVADLFSLGATLMALLSEEPTPPEWAGELAPVLHGLLVKDPLRRFSPVPVPVPVPVAGREGWGAWCRATGRGLRTMPTPSLPDAGLYAVTPTKQGFSAANGGTACLVLGRHAVIGGEVGRFRDTGTELWLGHMSIGAQGGVHRQPPRRHGREPHRRHGGEREDTHARPGVTDAVGAV
jgi:hypothetical protein